MALPIEKNEYTYCKLDAPILHKVVVLFLREVSSYLPPHAPRLSFQPFRHRGFLFIETVFMGMNILKESKGYFKMTEEQKQILQARVFVEALTGYFDFGVDADALDKHLTQLEARAVEKEHYEVAELIRQVHKDLLDIDYGHGL